MIVMSAFLLQRVEVRTMSHSIAQAGLELKILLPHLPK
jgi:hypothetical protein